MRGVLVLLVAECTGDGFVVEAEVGLTSAEGGCRLELLRGRREVDWGEDSETPNSVMERESAGWLVMGKLFTAPIVLKEGMVGEGGVEGLHPRLWGGRLGGNGKEGRESSIGLVRKEGSSGTERDRAGLRLLVVLMGVDGWETSSSSLSMRYNSEGERMCCDTGTVWEVLGNGGSSSPYEVVDDLLECDFWKNFVEAMSDDIGDDDLVVVLGLGSALVPVDGRDLGSVSERAAGLCVGAVEGRIPDIDDRDCMNLDNNIPVSPTISSLGGF